MNASLICYTLPGITPTQRSFFKRELKGYIDSSNNGRYKYKREGLLQKIPNFVPIRSVIIVQSQNKIKIIDLLKKYRAKYHIFDVTISPKLLKI